MAYLLMLVFVVLNGTMLSEQQNEKAVEGSGHGLFRFYLKELVQTHKNSQCPSQGSNWALLNISQEYCFCGRLCVIDKKYV
jgi:hypothetical protein